MVDQIYKDMLDSLESYIVLLDSDANIVFTNSAWRGLVILLGCNAHNSWIGRSYLDCGDVLQLDSIAFKTLIHDELRLIIQGKQSKFVIECPRSSIESKIWLEVVATSVMYNNERYVLLNHVNIIQRKADQAEIARLTIKDSSTGLANTKGFAEFFKNEWLRSMRSCSEVALLVVEMDPVEVSQRQQLLVADVFSKHARRACDLACSLKDNQFTLVLGHVNCLSCDVIAREIHRELFALGMHDSDGNSVNIHIAFSSATPTLIDDPAMLLDSVALALDKAKKASASTIVSHSPTIVFKQSQLTKN